MSKSGKKIKQIKRSMALSCDDEGVFCWDDKRRVVKKWAFSTPSLLLWESEPIPTAVKRVKQVGGHVLFHCWQTLSLGRVAPKIAYQRFHAPSDDDIIEFDASTELVAGCTNTSLVILFDYDQNVLRVLQNPNASPLSHHVFQSVMACIFNPQGDRLTTLANMELYGDNRAALLCTIFDIARGQVAATHCIKEMGSIMWDCRLMHDNKNVLYGLCLDSCQRLTAVFSMVNEKHFSMLPFQNSHKVLDAQNGVALLSSSKLLYLNTMKKSKKRFSGRKFILNANGTELVSVNPQGVVVTEMF